MIQQSILNTSFMCVSPRFYCTVDLLREFARGKLEQKDRNPVMQDVQSHLHLKLC